MGGVTAQCYGDTLVMILYLQTPPLRPHPSDRTITHSRNDTPLNPPHLLCLLFQRGIPLVQRLARGVVVLRELEAVRYGVAIGGYERFSRPALHNDDRVPFTH